MSKDSLLKGTIILAVAALVARVLGLVQRVPLQHLLHDDGMGTFGIAFNIYTIMLTIATAGIPSALSKLVSERIELRQYEEADRIYRAAIYFAVSAGVIMTVLVYLIAPSYATYIAKDENAVLSIRALAPALLFFPLIAIMRGYFQGRQSMMPNGISQIVEQILRLVTAIGLVVLILFLDWGKAWAAAGASFGGVMGAVGALAIMVYYYIRLRREDASLGLRRRSFRTSQQETYKEIYKRIFHLAVPIVLYSILVPLIYFIDSSLLKGLLSGQMSPEQAQDLLGILTARAQSFAGIPIILAISISQSIVPIISSAFARNDMALVNAQATKALRISVISGLPVILFIVIAAGSLNGLLFANESGTGVIIALTASTFFQILMQTSGAILMGLGRMRVLINHVAIGVIVKLAAVFAFAPWLGVYGFVASTALCFAVMTLLNLKVLRRVTDVRMFSLKSWERLVVSSAIICFCGSLIESFGDKHITLFYARINHFFTACLVGIVVLGLYSGLLLLTRIITKEDIAAFPTPIRKLMGRFGAKIAAK